MSVALAFLLAVVLTLRSPELPELLRFWPALPLLALWPLRRWRWVAAAVAGVLLVVGTGQRRLDDDWSCTRDRALHEVTGRIAEPPSRLERGTRFVLDTRGEPAAVRLPPRIQVQWYDEAPALAAGERWRLRLRLRCRHGWRNPGAFDRELDLLRRGIGATASVTRDGGQRLAAPRRRDFVEALRQRVAARIDASVPAPRAAGLVQGLAVGLRAEIPSATWRAFVATGTVHLLAISGMHVTAFAAWLIAGLGLLYRLPLPPLLRQRRQSLTACIAASGTTAYAALAGGSVPTLRTLTGVLLLLALGTLRRHVRPPAWLVATGVALAIADPLALVTPGFWLSFLAVGSLLALADARAGGLAARALVLLRTQAVVTIGLCVPLAAFFGSVSWVAPLANLIAVPFFSVVVLVPVLGGVACTALGLPFDAAAYGLAAWLLEGFVPALEWLAARAGALVYLAPVPVAALAAAGALMGLALWLPLRSVRALALISGIALFAARDARPPAGAAELVLFDVGQGLAAAIFTRQHALLFDTGPAFMGDGGAAAQMLTGYLATRQVSRLDLLLVSHPDADHAGGTAAVREALRPRRVLAGGHPLPVAATACRKGQRWRWDGVEFEVLHPPQGDFDDNDGSCVLALRTRAGRVLLIADIGASIEADAADSWARNADVVLVPHHGSRYSSTPEFIAAAGPRLALISAGFGNRWNMPADRVVAGWRRAGATVLRTDRDGAIRVRLGTVPRDIGIATERRDARRWWQAGWAW